ncbi:hypothetical protein LFL96_13495 [Paraburkholderia sp. D15]|uniref:hypothetical protein n=1 Tax=Paraburkholderia sp. D15 TaxID=2880218 RepID=UPI00247AF749|nr:hypothetical protein [Paraburkholderia sp. D15]WGS48788.1 hypothetical protein LFL96_13495 [Paraburkholderia sp. D15]
MSTFIYDENKLTIQGFYTSATPSENRQAKKLITSTSGDRSLYGNGKMTGICFLKYSYSDNSVTLDSLMAEEIENNIKSNIQFLEHAQNTDITTKGWLCFTSDDAGRNDQYYHDCATLVDTAVPTPTFTGSSVSNTLQFFLLPPVQKSGAVATEIYAFYVPLSENYSDPTAPSSPYSTYGTSTIKFNVAAPVATTEDFTMSEKFVSGSGYDSCTHIYYIDYNSSKKNSQIPLTILRWDFETKYADDQGSGKMVNMGITGHSGVISLFTQNGDPGVANVTILALNASESALWPADDDHPPHNQPYNSAEPLDFITDGSSTGLWQTEGMDAFFNSGFNPAGVAGVPLVVIFGGHFTDTENSRGGCTDSDFRYNHLYANDCFGTTLEIIIDNDSSDYWNHNQAIHACSVYWPS